MTLLGNAVLSRLWESRRYRVLPFLGGRGTGEVIEVYPGATLRQLGLANYKSRSEEAIRLGIAACMAAEITLVRALCCRYNSGGKTPDYDAADAFIALCTAILHAEGTCRMAIDSDASLKGSKAPSGCRGSRAGVDVMWRKPIEPGQLVDVTLTPQERDLILEKTLIDDEMEGRLRGATPRGSNLVVRLTLDDVDDLAGHVAAEANPCSEPHLRRVLDAVYDRLASIEHAFTDEGEPAETAES